MCQAERLYSTAPLWTFYIQTLLNGSVSAPLAVDMSPHKGLRCCMKRIRDVLKSQSDPSTPIYFKKGREKYFIPFYTSRIDSKQKQNAS